MSFRIDASTFTVLLGLNGAGKSTLFALITRLFNAQQGVIRIFGHDLSRQPGEALKRLGVVFQARTLDLDLTVRQNLLYHAALHGMAGREASERAERVLAQVALKDREHDKARNLSGGQMRRVEIARALLHEPKLLLLDEPTVGLDIGARADIAGDVRRLVVSEGLSVLWATHLIDEVSDSDHAVVLHKGAVRAQGLVSGVVAAAAHGISPALSVSSPTTPPVRWGMIDFSDILGSWLSANYTALALPSPQPSPSWERGRTACP